MAASIFLLDTETRNIEVDIYFEFSYVKVVKFLQELLSI